LQAGFIDKLVLILDKIIVGSYHGILRIFMPRTAEFKPEDLMLEIQMTQPILQLEAGHFVSLV
jgi:Bardet-Biedl syndrome 9 protein